MYEVDLNLSEIRSYQEVLTGALEDATTGDWQIHYNEGGKTANIVVTASEGGTLVMEVIAEELKAEDAELLLLAKKLLPGFLLVNEALLQLVEQDHGLGDDDE